MSQRLENEYARIANAAGYLRAATGHFWMHPTTQEDFSVSEVTGVWTWHPGIDAPVSGDEYLPHDCRPKTGLLPASLAAWLDEVQRIRNQREEKTHGQKTISRGEGGV